jgi:hypothetical protein
MLEDVRILLKITKKDLLGARPCYIVKDLLGSYLCLIFTAYLCR